MASWADWFLLGSRKQRTRSAFVLSRFRLPKLSVNSFLFFYLVRSVRVCLMDGMFYLSLYSEHSNIRLFEYSSVRIMSNVEFEEVAQKRPRVSQDLSENSVRLPTSSSFRQPSLACSACCTPVRRRSERRASLFIRIMERFERWPPTERLPKMASKR